MYIKTLLAIAITSVLSACSVTEQDIGDESSSAVSGRTVDGYIASAVVFVDTNENGILEAWEPRALTDKDGFYSYSTKGAGTNYCNLPETDKDAVYCLRTPPGASDVLIRMVRGYDVTTGESFVGSMSVRSKAGVGIASPTVGSPITSILSNMTPTAQTNFSAMYPMTLDELSSDILNDLEEITDVALEQNRRTKLSIAIQAHKLSDIISAYLEDLYKADNGTDALFGNDVEFPVDATMYIYEALADEITTTPATVKNLFTNPVTVWNVIIAARDAINADVRLQNVKRLDNGDPLLDEETVLTSAIIQPIADRIVEVANFIDTLMSPIINTFGLSDSEDIESKLRAVEIVTSVLRDPVKSNVAPMDIGAQRAIDLALGIGFNEVLYLDNIKSSKTELTSLVAKFNDPVDGGDVVENDADFALRDTLETQIGGGILGTDQVQLNMESTEVDSTDTAAMTFNPDGTLEVRLDFTDSSGDNPLNITADDTLTGSWEAINDYTIIANIEIAGVQQPVIIRTNSDGTGYLFDYGGELTEWKTP